MSHGAYVATQLGAAHDTHMRPHQQIPERLGSIPDKDDPTIAPIARKLESIIMPPTRKREREGVGGSGREWEGVGGREGVEVRAWWRW